MTLAVGRFARSKLFFSDGQREPDSGETVLTTAPMPIAASAVGAVSAKLHVPKRYASCWGIGTTFWAFKVRWAVRACIVILLSRLFFKVETACVTTKTQSIEKNPKYKSGFRIGK